MNDVSNNTFFKKANNANMAETKSNVQVVMYDTLVQDECEDDNMSISSSMYDVDFEGDADDESEESELSPKSIKNSDKFTNQGNRIQTCNNNKIQVLPDKDEYDKTNSNSDNDVCEIIESSESSVDSNKETCSDGDSIQCISPPKRGNIPLIDVDSDSDSTDIQEIDTDKIIPTDDESNEIEKSNKVSNEFVDIWNGKMSNLEEQILIHCCISTNVKVIVTRLTSRKLCGRFASLYKISTNSLKCVIEDLKRVEKPKKTKIKFAAWSRSISAILHSGIGPKKKAKINVSYPKSFTIPTVLNECQNTVALNSEDNECNTLELVVYPSLSTISDFRTCLTGKSVPIDPNDMDDTRLTTILFSYVKQLILYGFPKDPYLLMNALVQLYMQHRDDSIDNAFSFIINNDIYGLCTQGMTYPKSQFVPNPMPLDKKSVNSIFHKYSQSRDIFVLKKIDFALTESKQFVLYPLMKNCKNEMNQPILSVVVLLSCMGSIGPCILTYPCLITCDISSSVENHELTDQVYICSSKDGIPSNKHMEYYINSLVPNYMRSLPGENTVIVTEHDKLFKFMSRSQFRSDLPFILQLQQLSISNDPIDIFLINNLQSCWGDILKGYILSVYDFGPFLFTLFGRWQRDMKSIFFSNLGVQ